MKNKEKYYVIAVLLIAFFSSCSDKKGEKNGNNIETVELKTPANSTLEELGASFILALKESDSKAISDFLPTKEDVENIILVYEGTGNEKKEILSGSEENTEKIKTNTLQSIDEIIKKGKNAGINWEDVSFTNSEYEIKKEHKIESVDLTIAFTYKSLTYKIQIAECIKTNRGWLIFDKPQWKG